MRTAIVVVLLSGMLGATASPIHSHPQANGLTLLGGDTGGGQAVTTAGGRAFLLAGAQLLQVRLVDDERLVQTAPPHVLPGVAAAVASDGPHLYVPIEGAGLLLLDASADDVGQTAFVAMEDATGLAVADGYAYLTTSSEVHVLDCRDSEQPVEVSIWQPEGEPWSPPRIAVDGAMLYAITHLGVEPVVDVVEMSDPAQPQHMGRLGLGSDFYLTDMAVGGQYLYLTDTVVGEVAVIDVSDPTQPQLLEPAHVHGYPLTHMAVDDDRLFVSAYSGSSDRYAVVELSLVEPGTPTRTAVTPLDWPPAALHASDELLYVSAETGGLGVLDAKRGEPLQESAFLDTIGSVEAVAPSPAGPWIIADDGLWRWDGVDSSQLCLEWSDVAWAAVSVVASDEFVAVGGNGGLGELGAGGGLWILRSGTQGTAEVVGLQAFPDEVVIGLALDGATAYVRSSKGDRTEPTGLLHVVELGEPSEPVLVGTVERRLSRFSTQRVELVAVSGRAYIDEGEEGVWVVDAADRAAPVDAGLIAATGEAVTGLALAGEHLYVASRRVVDIYDIGDRADGVHVGSWLSPGQSEIQGLAASEETLVAVASEDSGDGRASKLHVHALGLEDKRVPREQSFVALPLGASVAQVAAEQRKAYVAGDAAGLVVISFDAQPTRAYLPVAYREP